MEIRLLAESFIEIIQLQLVEILNQRVLLVLPFFCPDHPKYFEIKQKLSVIRQVEISQTDNTQPSCTKVFEIPHTGNTQPSCTIVGNLSK